MSNVSKPTGSIVWTDLTIPNAENVRDFYVAVTGWKPTPCDMGGYEDYTMTVGAEETPVAGICHARGVNAGLPPQWLNYISVANLDDSLKRCVELGGAILREARDMGDYGRYAVIRDPAGAVAALIELAAAEGA